MTERDILTLEPLGIDPEVGRWLAAVLDEYIARLAAVREFVLDRLRPMTAAEFHRVRSLPAYDVSPDWVIHHLLQHEAEHRAHIARVRDTAPPD